MRGSSLVWEKIKKVSWHTKKWVSIYSTILAIPRDLAFKLVGKQIISIKISKFKEIDGRNVEQVSYDGSIKMKKAFDELLEPKESIPDGTKITITYK